MGFVRCLRGKSHGIEHLSESRNILSSPAVAFFIAVVFLKIYDSMLEHAQGRLSYIYFSYITLLSLVDIHTQNNTRFGVVFSGRNIFYPLGPYRSLLYTILPTIKALFITHARGHDDATRKFIASRVTCHFR